MVKVRRVSLSWGSSGSGDDVEEKEGWLRVQEVEGREGGREGGRSNVSKVG